MIGFVRGALVTYRLKGQVATVLLDVRDVGYEVVVTATTVHQILRELPPPEQMTDKRAVQLFTHQVVRDDQMLLYGFLQMPERDLFSQILAVAGVGAAVAMALLNTLKLPDLVRAIVSGNTRVLSLTPGVGQKTAARLSLELKTKLADWRSLQGETPSISQISADLQADLETTLLALGYASQEISAALVAIADQVPPQQRLDLEAWLKCAIVWLSQI
ncbi:MAG: Holliday junction branch migration protein RuvA [Pseudanabaenaceae cyanobacterium bins.68]|nr:Holliday junction branch migration protein RuvA [Pseudanabaenaceae cyanobacterium bins.68]